MEQNPLEQQNIRINKGREELKGNLGYIFDNRSTFENDIKKLKDSLVEMGEQGLVFNKEEIYKGLEQLIEIKDRDIFISYGSKVLDPVIVLKVTQSKIFDKIQREVHMRGLDKVGMIQLSQVMYCGIEEEERIVHIHLSSSRDFMTKDRIEDFNSDLENGLKKLAEIVKSNENIDKVIAISWIVAKSPERLKKLGFTIEGEISKEEKEKNWKGEDIPIHSAFMTREYLLERYGNN